MKRVEPSDADLSGNGAGVIDFNAEIPHRSLAWCDRKTIAPP